MKHIKNFNEALNKPKVTKRTLHFKGGVWEIRLGDVVVGEVPRPRGTSDYDYKILAQKALLDVYPDSEDIDSNSEFLRNYINYKKR